jgi:hypothetical protein
VTKQVNVPIPITCIPQGVPPEKPYATDKVSLDADLFELVRSLLIEREERKVAELNLRAALDGCR